MISRTIDFLDLNILDYDNTKIVINSGLVALIGPAYDTNNPTVEILVQNYNRGLSSITATTTITGSDQIKYILSKDDIYYYWDGANWSLSAETYTQSNTLSEINTNIAGFNTGQNIYTKVKIFLHSDSGATTPSISDFTLNYIDQNFVSLFDVKVYNDYTYIEDREPTTSDDATAGYANNETWLDSTTGYSYNCTNAIAGTWVRIEKASDYKILNSVNNDLNTAILYTGNYFTVKRNTLYEDLDTLYYPDNLSRSDNYIIASNESVYSECAFNLSDLSITFGGDIYGVVSSFKTGDIIYISGSTRNNGFYRISYKTDEKLYLNSTLKNETSNAFVILTDIDQGFIKIVGLMTNYNIYTKSNFKSGLTSERIGTYSYTRDLGFINGMGYPIDVVSGLDNYVITVLGGISNFVN